MHKNWGHQCLWWWCDSWHRKERQKDKGPVSSAGSRALELSDPDKVSTALKCRLDLPLASVVRELDLRITLDPISSQSSVPLSVPVSASISDPATSLVPESSVTMAAQVHLPTY